jgi:hypothetical protein
VGVQLIFVVEANKSCKSDWIYIKSTIDYFYEYNRTGLKLSPVYMDGKGKYKQKEKEVKSLISQYSKVSKGNKSKVIYCLDCDECDSKSEDLTFLKTVKKYCDDRGYDFIWFCKDVEQVYIGKRVDKSQKKNESTKFKKNNLITKVDVHRLSGRDYRIKTSNIMTVLDSYQELKRK